MFNYEKSGDEIYRQSWVTIQREADLSQLSESAATIAVRMIHACGMVDLVDDLVICDEAMVVGNSALADDCAIVCDVEMVRQGIIQRNLPRDNPVLCNVASGATRKQAAALGTTRSAAAIDGFRDTIAGGIVVIGNAPTALFHLLEMIDRGAKPPALIIGCPVGFVGAAESKQALISHGCGIPYVTVRGRRGGSAIAAAAFNAIVAGLAA